MTSWTFAASILLFLGLWRVGCRDRVGFVFSVIGAVMWVVTALNRSQWDLALVCAVFGAIAAVNCWKWGQPET